jgi:hypothetical protein
VGQGRECNDYLWRLHVQYDTLTIIEMSSGERGPATGHYRRKICVWPLTANGLTD